MYWSKVCIIHICNKHHISEDVEIKMVNHNDQERSYYFLKNRGSTSHIYLPLQHGNFIREEVNDVLFPKGLGQKVANSGTQSREHTGKQQSFIWSKYSSS